MTEAMALDPDMQRAIERLALLPFRPLAELSPGEARLQDATLFDPLWNDGRPALAQVEDIALSCTSGILKARLYDPGLGADAPALLYLHGGGFVLGGLGSHDSLCRHLALAGRCRVVALDYRLAPEHRFPVQLCDCIEALHAISATAGDLGIDRDRIAVAGDSAGANLALNLLRSASAGEAPPFRCGVLIYGMFSPALDGRSRHLYGDGGAVLSVADLAWFWRHYLADPADASDPRVNLLAADLRGLPPVFVGTAEYDPLLDDSTALARLLSSVDTRTVFRLWPGLTHAAFQMIQALPAMQAHMADVGSFLRHNLARPSAGDM